MNEIINSLSNNFKITLTHTKYVRQKKLFHVYIKDHIEKICTRHER